MSKRVTLARVVSDQLLGLLRMLPKGVRRLPSEEELCEKLNVSRATLREGLSRLERSGFITKRHGVGNMANPSVLNTPMRFDAEINLRRMLESGGGTVNTIRLTPYLTEKEPFEISAFSHITFPCPWIIQRSEHTVDDETAVLTFNVFPSTARLPEEGELSGTSYRELIGIMAGEELSHTITAFSACPAWPELSVLFGITVDVPILFWRQKSFGMSDDMICESFVFFNPRLVTLHSFNRWE